MQISYQSALGKRRIRSYVVQRSLIKIAVRKGSIDIIQEKRNLGGTRRNIDPGIEIGIVIGLAQSLEMGIDIEDDGMIDQEVLIVGMNKTKVVPIQKAQAEEKVEVQSALRGGGNIKVLEEDQDLPIRIRMLRQVFGLPSLVKNLIPHAIINRS
jgi:hypothetical protein